MTESRDDGKTCIEYDRASSLFGQFEDERVDSMAASLDQKLEDLAATATRRRSAQGILIFDKAY
jgi:hypothetical protein